MGTAQSNNAAANTTANRSTNTTANTTANTATHGTLPPASTAKSSSIALFHNSVDEGGDRGRVSYTLEDDLVLDKTDPTFPWLPVIECVAETLECGIVRTYNLEEAKVIILSAARYPLIVPDCIVQDGGSVLRWSSMEGPWSKALAHRKPQLSSLLHFASDLLRTDSNLSRLRFSAVPSRMSETMFWCLYFDRITVLLRRRLSGPEHYFTTKHERPLSNEQTSANITTRPTSSGTTTRTKTTKMTTKTTNVAKTKTKNKRKRVAQWKYGLNGRWERLLSIHDGMVRSVGYAICSIPMWLMTTTNPVSVGEDSHGNLSTEWWTSDVHMDEMLEWIMSVDRSKSATVKLRRFIRNRLKHNGTTDNSTPVLGQQSWMTACHLYMLSHCPLFHPYTMIHNTKTTLIPLMGKEMMDLSDICSPIVLHKTKAASDIVDSKKSTRASEAAINHSSLSQSRPRAPQVVRRDTPNPTMEPTPEELRIVSELIKDQQTTDLLVYAIVQGRVASVQKILQEHREHATLQVLLSSGDSKLKPSDSCSGTPLHVAVLQCRADCVRALLMAGAKVSCHMRDQKETHFNVLEIAKDNEMMSQCLELWYMQAVYGDKKDVVEDFCMAGRSVLDPMLDGTIPLLIEPPPPTDVYNCLWNHFQAKNRTSASAEGSSLISDVAYHQVKVVMPLLKAQATAVDGWATAGSEVEDKDAVKVKLAEEQLNVQLRDIKSTMVFMTNAPPVHLQPNQMHGGSIGTSEVKSHQPNSNTDDAIQNITIPTSCEFVERNSHIDISTIDVVHSCINGSTVLSLSVQTMREYCHQQKVQISQGNTVRMHVEEYNMYVHGWIYYPLPSFSSSASSPPTASTTKLTSTNPNQHMNQHSMHHRNQIVPDCMTACWSGWYVSRPVVKSTIDALHKYFVGPLFYLTNIFDAAYEDLGPRCCPYRFERKDVNGDMAIAEMKQVVYKDHGTFFTRGTFEAGIKEKALALDQQVHGTAKSVWIFMVIELRYNKMLNAWIEASRGVVR